MLLQYYKKHNFIQLYHNHAVMSKCCAIEHCTSISIVYTVLQFSTVLYMQYTSQMTILQFHTPLHSIQFRPGVQSRHYSLIYSTTPVKSKVRNRMQNTVLQTVLYNTACSKSTSKNKLMFIYCLQHHSNSVSLQASRLKSSNTVQQ